MRTFIKKNSHTQRRADRFRGTIEEICHRAGISRDEWDMLFFETGCRWAEQQYYNSPALALSMLTNPARGFWGYFLCTYIEDDEQLIAKRIPLDNGQYETIKSQFQIQ